MSRRDQWREVLEAELRRWSAKPCDQLIAELADTQAYEVQLESKPYQVEVELHENIPTYLHVMIAVDDGTLPASLSPATETFICRKAHSQG